MDLLQLRNAANNNNMLDDETGHYSTNQLINTFSTTSNPLHRNPLDYELAIAEPSSNINRLGYYYTNETNIPNSFLTSHEQEQLNSNDIFKSSTCSSEMASLMHHHSIWGGVNSHNTNTNSIVPIFHENQANPHQWTNRSITVENNNNNNMGGSFFNDYNPQVSKEYVKPIHQEQQQPSTSSIGFRNVGPLGPFTGDVGVDDESGGVVVSAKGSTSNSGSSCSMLYGSKEKENSNVDGGIGNNFCLSSSTSSSRPECQKNKAQLLFMHEEVCFL
ncbi:hypothetical protein L195_g028460 [Trifolium pratense]|uniref:Uncharacterized protein n=1 Tax=Trifolium pratense TaxID=57577 RepID=A0A2K3L1Z7_TRIPR|nr:hypothetical protein L195_g028460 [Trifolium pratense]